MFGTGQDEGGAWAIRDSQGKTVLWLGFGAADASRTEEQRRLQQERSVAFAMLMHQRQGKASVWSVLEPGILRMVLELIRRDFLDQLRRNFLDQLSLHAWPATAEQVAQVAEFNAINAMSALSLSQEGPGSVGGAVSRSEGEESEAFPLVVVRVLVLQVSYCLFKSMCRVCPSIGTDAESCATGWRASCRNTSRVRLPPLSGVTQRQALTY